MATSKKIAIIGCSHFAVTEQPTQGKHNWSYQLYRLYPHHQYRNYSMGGQGIEQFQWSLLDAKKWGADIVFLNRTYQGRWAFQAQVSHEEPIWEYTIQHQEINWQEVRPDFEYFWGTVNDSPKYAGGLPRQGRVYTSQDPKKSVIDLNKLELFWKTNLSGSELRRLYEVEWYRNAHNLYNFDNLFLIDWDYRTHQSQETSEDGSQRMVNNHTSNTWDISVVEYFRKKYHYEISKSNDSSNPMGDNLDNYLASIGIHTSEYDNHLSPLGNAELLNEYILTNQKVKTAIEK